MFCDQCKKNQATTHLKNSINGIVHETHLCSECAALKGFTNLNPFILDDLWSAVFSNANLTKVEKKRCSLCETSFEDIASSGKLGCPHCYIEFKEELIPSLRKIHSKTHHIGQTPKYLKEEAQSEQETSNTTDILEQLQNQLKEAIKNEEYEKAAEIRDKIKELER